MSRQFSPRLSVSGECLCPETSRLTRDSSSIVGIRSGPPAYPRGGRMRRSSSKAIRPACDCLGGGCSTVVPVSAGSSPDISYGTRRVKWQGFAHSWQTPFVKVSLRLESVSAILDISRPFSGWLWRSCGCGCVRCGSGSARDLGPDRVGSPNRKEKDGQRKREQEM
jgi:hypothetical protein